MTIKDVCKKTNLTAKAVRYYEEEGLLKPERTEDNSYKNYTEEDLVILKKIKLFRYLDFSIDEIRKLLKSDKEKMKKLILEKTAELQEKNVQNNIKKDLCKELNKLLKTKELNVDDFEEVIILYEDKELNEMLSNIEVPSTFEFIITLFIYLGPVLALFTNIKNQLWDHLALNSVLAMISAVLLTFNIKNYIKFNKHKQDVIKVKNNEFRNLLPAFIDSLIILIISLLMSSMLIQKYIAPTGWLFYQLQMPTFLVGILMFGEVLLFYNLLKKLINKEIINVKANVCYFLVLVASFVMCISNVVFVTKDNIINYSLGKSNTYSYTDVTKVETKFGNKIVTLNDYERIGRFKYVINLDGKKFVFSNPVVNPEYELYINNTYLEIEELDNKLMNLNVKKESTDENSEYCELDKQYCDRFIKIINNK